MHRVTRILIILCAILKVWSQVLDTEAEEEVWKFMILIKHPIWSDVENGQKVITRFMCQFQALVLILLLEKWIYHWETGRQVPSHWPHDYILKRVLLLVTHLSIQLTTLLQIEIVSDDFT